VEKGTGAPCASLWKILCLETQKVQRVEKPSDLLSDLPPLLFIHGVEFNGPHEAIQDLVEPMLRYLSLDKLKNRSILILSWNSLIVPRDVSDRFFAAATREKIFRGLTELIKCRSYMNDVERRAYDAAKYLSSFILEWNSHHKTGPIVITHSMGSLVWVEALKNVLESSSMLARPGIWWSLQPAMCRQSFTDSGAYRMVSKLYTGHESARAMIWYSRMDFILSTLFILSKRTFALGQFGCPEQSLPQRDITSIVGEAHGMSHLTRIRGNFFTRAGTIIATEAANLGII
jgi:hypothetical protein